MQSQILNVIKSEEIHSLQDNILSKFIEGTLFIINEDLSLHGIITDGDVRKCFSNNLCHNIEDNISLNPKKILSSQSASDALLVLRENQINILAVVDENNKLIGYITLHMLLDSFSPERLYISDDESTNDSNEQRHLARYKFATNFLAQSSETLDCACGSGYGSKMLSLYSNSVLGVDLSNDAITFAKQNNFSSNINFKQSDLSMLDFDASSFDSIVSIETLEHIPHDTFLNFLTNISTWIKSGGVFIGSSPMLRYKDNKPYVTNPYHINEMPKQEFINAIKTRLINFEIHFYYQDQDRFLPLCDEHTGFCIVVARKR
ncbi:methyltransferase domain-containing protein [Candidatus Sulfurimonas marisnigri]|uniref:Methyltransferase domain-containing protein n=1 Tax=Candidatus Sulfurimonas marisnigri TaxID=2740405 RepID=A0A7S7RQK2_9BACT|nr:methyltransferase domain-containing protein [Candidatus Sulfurimonas marisnigri]QOY54555.1 methyltransferase domain-containing protein [Candidatus Sulfurimonas marisnigri]